MLKSIEAIFDGEVFRPAEEVELEANTRVWLQFETAELQEQESLSFLDLASRLELDGPEDWSLRLNN